MERFIQCHTPSVTVQTNKEILETALDFYKSLYTEEPVDEASQDWLLSQLDKTLALGGGGGGCTPKNFVVTVWNVSYSVTPPVSVTYSVRHLWTG